MLARDALEHKFNPVGDYRELFEEFKRCKEFKLVSRNSKNPRNSRNPKDSRFSKILKNPTSFESDDSD